MIKQIHQISKHDLKTIKRGNRKPHGKLMIKNHHDNIIELQNVNKYYHDNNNIYQILKNVSLSIQRGKLVVIYGQSGSGKTTLLNVISGLDRATKGNVIVDNTNLSALKDHQMTYFRRKNVGFIFQSYNLLSDLNAYDNAKIGQVLQPDKAKVLSIEELFSDMGIKHILKQDIRNLSGGQQQRVAIARALAKNPQLIFADEPTGSLDSESSQKVIELLKQMNSKYRTTIIVVTHDPEWMKVADQVLQVKDGKVIVNTAISSLNQDEIKSEIQQLTREKSQDLSKIEQQLETSEVSNETID